MLVSEISILTPTGEAKTCCSPESCKLTAYSYLDALVDTVDSTCAVLPRNKNELQIKLKHSRKVSAVLIKGNLTCPQQQIRLPENPQDGCTGACAAATLCSPQEQFHDTCVYLCKADDRMIDTVSLSYKDHGNICEVVLV